MIGYSLRGIREKGRMGIRKGTARIMGRTPDPGLLTRRTR